MERRGAGKYPSAFLQKTFKELEAAGKTTITNAGNGAAAKDEGDEAVKEEEDAGEGDDA